VVVAAETVIAGNTLSMLDESVMIITKAMICIVFAKLNLFLDFVEFKIKHLPFVK